MSHKTLYTLVLDMLIGKTLGTGTLFTGRRVNQGMDIGFGLDLFIILGTTLSVSSKEMYLQHRNNIRGQQVDPRLGHGVRGYHADL